MTHIILDTNALLMPFQFNLNLDDEIERLLGDVSSKVYVPSSVTKELKGLGKKGALKLSEKYKDIDVEKKGDDGVLEAAEKLQGIIVTNDSELKKRALKRKIPVAYLRSRSHLELAGEDWLFREKKGNIVKLKGEVVSGVNEGQYFLSINGYKDRFKDRFGFEPFEGTLNVRLEGEYLDRYEELKENEGTVIKRFHENGRDYGSVRCFRCKINNNSKGSSIDLGTLLILPEKTRYEKVLEIISKYELRDVLNLEDGDELEIFVHLD